MLSGKFQFLHPDTIIVDRAARQRQKLDNLEELADSIRAVGQLHPIIIDRNQRLVAGERRLTAIRDILGWDAVAVQWADEIPESALYLIELEENVKREDLDWRDHCAAVANYHRMQAQLAAEQGREWSVSDTATAINLDRTAVSKRIAVHEAIETKNPLVLAADKYSTAVGIVERKAARAKESQIDSIEALFREPESEDEQPNSAVPETLGDSDNPPPVANLPSPPAFNGPFLNCSFLDFAVSYSGPRFNFLHCDFPYGVNADRHNQGAASSFGGYEDSPDVYWTLIDALAESMPRLVADSAHMMFWFSMDYYAETKARLEQMGWRVNPFPLIWHKSDNSGILPDPKRGPRRIYETAFLCSRGDRFVVQSVANTFAAPNKKEIHMSEKNPDMLRHFFRMFVDEHSRVLDPTMGSGNAIRVAESMGAEHVLGLEMNEEFFHNACAAYEKERGFDMDV